MRQCRVCKRPVRSAHTQGFWEKRILRMIFIRSFRCTFCHQRFRAFSIRNGRPETAQEEAQKLSLFLQTEDQMDFQELIREMQRAEKKLTSKNTNKTDGEEESKAHANP